MRTPWFSLGSALLAVAVAAGALGAHLLRGLLDASSLALWETAVRYLFVGGFGLVATGLGAHVAPEGPWRYVGVALASGTVIFGVTVAALALGGPRWLGAVTPAGGLLLIGGFVAMAAAGFRRGRSS
ncbi:MAG: DUF423 domain-containing protein [Thermoanaerobaculaceae bacterium]|nr:DUF423 domain-containing protein [Thermoanaerobaculaceae bacterium]TAM55755.1 MAG: DUF423 domain-containing protein [Acidobacteriota bacterium]